MSKVQFDESRFKSVKSALREVIEEERDLVRDILEEALEDIGLANAIEEGEHGPIVSRDHVFQVFDGSA